MSSIRACRKCSTVFDGLACPTCKTAHCRRSHQRHRAKYYAAKKAKQRRLEAEGFTAVAQCRKCGSDFQLKPFHVAFSEYRCPTCRRKSPEAALRYYKAYVGRHPDKALAHYEVYKARKRGDIVNQPCEQCGAARGQAHHDDYSKPLDVRWLCYDCHAAHHARMKEMAK